MTRLTDPRKAQTFALIIRATWERGVDQIAAIREINARGCWLSENQLAQAGLTADQYRAICRGGPA